MQERLARIAALAAIMAAAALLTAAAGRSSSVTPRHWRLVRTFSAMPVTIRARILRRSD